MAMAFRKACVPPQSCLPSSRSLLASLQLFSVYMYAAFGVFLKAQLTLSVSP